jgi:predicted adenylyl cyclase CyaB
MKKVDYTEYEAKFYPVDKELYRKKLISIGAVLLLPERKMIREVGDTRVNSMLKPHSAIRIRDEGDFIRLSYKTSAHDAGILSDQKEIDVKVSDFKKTKLIMEEAGVVFNRRQESLREEWAFNGTQITIDTWPGLDTYSEIEAESEEKVKEMAILLGFDWSKKIVMAVTKLYSIVYGLPKEEALEKASFITFENNPFKNMKKVWTPKTQQEG